MLVRAGDRRRSRSPGGRSRSGAARELGARPLRATTVAAHRVPRLHGSRRASTHGSRPGARRQRGLRLGVRQRRRSSSCRDLRGRAIVGFDVTDFLDHEITRTPVTLYLFHLVRQLLDGRRLVCWMDEFWRLLADPAFEHFAKDGPKTWRKLNGVMALATQSASDVLESPISRTIIEQTPTKVFFPNRGCERRGLSGGLRPHRAGVQARQGAARARLATVPRQAGSSQRRVRARPEGLRCRARGDLRTSQRTST